MSVCVMEHFGGNTWNLPNFSFFKERTNLLLLMFCVYQGLASFRLDQSRGYWLLFSSSRIPFPPHLVFYDSGQNKMDHAIYGKSSVCFEVQTPVS